MAIKFEFIGQQGEQIDSDTPPIHEMQQVIKAYLYQRKGVVIEPTINWNQTQKELSLLIFMYRHVIQNFNFH